MSGISIDGARAAVLALGNVAVLVCGLTAGQAFAQNTWEVNDSQAGKYLEEIRDGLGTKGSTDKENVNGKLNNMMKIGSAKKSGDAAPEPTEVLQKDKPSMVKKEVADRCPASSTTSDKSLQDLHTICEELVKTETAQYNYSLAMYEIFKKRKERLDEIESNRGNLSASDQGKLQDNTNALLALMARMELDMNQYRFYMEAYAARTTYLKTVRDFVSNQVVNGKGKDNSALGSIGREAIGAGVLKTALDEMKSDRIKSPWKSRD
ncbi:hypothetical protein [Lysobacter capsici]|uniref:hypothetical protein n=1 Tax=Lysobacter capsici TaxID=435897 RepID=UPI001C0014D9|nr:hypothetical protein [Lysobacter capsici]QWF15276.1 hypothetical protein KME82_15910 [Lysobacter capsici]